jgi:hypothetical protein
MTDSFIPTPSRNVGGRPKGSTTITKTSEQLLTHHIRESSKFIGDLREFAEEQIDCVRKEIKTKGLGDRIPIVSQLVDIMEKMGKSMQVSVNCLNALSSTKNDEELSDADIAKLLQGE